MGNLNPRFSQQSAARHRRTSPQGIPALLLSGLFLLLFSTPVMAIPGPGNYEWVAGGDITGTFTSDGTNLTIWNFLSTFDTAQWTPLDRILFNDPGSFVAEDISAPPTPNTGTFVNVFWDFAPSSRIATILTKNGTAPLRFVNPVSTEPVPEPATMMLLSTGLVGLVGYRWRRNTDVRPRPAADPTTNK